MKPEFVVLSQLYAYNATYLTRLLELQAVAYAKQQGHPDEVAEAFAKTTLSDCEEDYKKQFRTCVNSLLSSYPDQVKVTGETASVEELLNRICSS